MLCKLRGALIFEGRVIAAISVCHAVLDVDDTVDDPIEKLAIMRDQKERPRILSEPGFQPQNGVEVQVVGGLIKQQQVGAAHEGLGHIETNTPAAGELLHCAWLIRRCEPEPMHEASGTTARVVAAAGRVARVQLPKTRTVV